MSKELRTSIEETKQVLEARIRNCKAKLKEVEERCIKLKDELNRI